MLKAGVSWSLRCSLHYGQKVSLGSERRVASGCLCCMARWRIHLGLHLFVSLWMGLLWVTWGILIHLRNSSNKTWCGVAGELSSCQPWTHFISLNSIRALLGCVYFCFHFSNVKNQDYVTCQSGEAGNPDILALEINQCEWTTSIFPATFPLLKFSLTSKFLHY